LKSFIFVEASHIAEGLKGFVVVGKEILSLVSKVLKSFNSVAIIHVPPAIVGRALLIDPGACFAIVMLPLAGVFAILLEALFDEARTILVPITSLESAARFVEAALVVLITFCVIVPVCVIVPICIIVPVCVIVPLKAVVPMVCAVVPVLKLRLHEIELTWQILPVALVIEERFSTIF